MSSAISSSEKRSRGKATFEYSRLSVIRPTRSWCLTSQYFALTFARSVFFDATISSRITLKTYGYEGSVNTDITRPLMPGAMTNLSRECLRWWRKSRKNRFLPPFCNPTIV